MKYVNILAATKFWFIVILAVILLLCVLIIICCSVIQTIDNTRKIKLLKSYGCERYLSGVPSVGGGAFYSWKTADYKINISERDIAKMKYRHLESLIREKKSKS